MYKWLFFLLLVPSVVFSQLNKDQFFEAMQTEVEGVIAQQKKNLESMSSYSERNAFLGAILMKESQFLATPKARLEQFKRGKTLLENEIKAHVSNVEFRLLRLMVQENCPKILGYNKEIQQDAQFVSKRYASLSEQIKKFVKNYSAHSPALKSQGIDK